MRVLSCHLGPPHAPCSALTSWRPLNALCPRFHMQTSATRTYIRRPARSTPALTGGSIGPWPPLCPRVPRGPASPSWGSRRVLHPHPSPHPPRGDLNQNPEAYPAGAVHTGSCSPSSPGAFLPLSAGGRGGETTSPVSLCGGGGWRLNRRRCC